MRKLPILASAVGLLVAFNAGAQNSRLSNVESFIQPAPATRLIGTPASQEEATRTITITPSTRFVNVSYGDVVSFKTSSGQEFAVRFDVGDGVSSFDLQRVAPPGALDHQVTAYIVPFDDNGA
jgi:type IV secretory pathway VirB9-like protein